MQARKEQHLSVKIINIMPTITKMIIHPEYKYLKEKFPQPVKDEEIQLFKYDSTLPMYLSSWPRGPLSN